MANGALRLANGARGLATAGMSFATRYPRLARSRLIAGRMRAMMMRHPPAILPR